MEEIKVGEYVRTIQGYIAKITYIDDEFIHADNTIYCYYEESPLMFIEEKMLDGTIFRASDYILKHSLNIIDLIEVGDYVNGEKVEKIAEPSLANCQIKLIYCNENEGLYKLILNNNDIKSVVTKEQFKSIEYIIEED